MKYGARPLMLLAALAACGPSSQTAAERAAAAARADSSAAGYEVGPVTSVSASRKPATDTAARPVVPGQGSAPGGTGSTTAGPTPADSAAQAGRGQSVASGTGGRGGSATNGGSARGGATSGTDRPRQDSTASTNPPLDPALEPEFIAYDTVRKTVTFQLAAGDEVAEQVSFNGSRRGGRTFTVPLGWRVTIAFVNRDPQLPHSMTVVDISGAVPEQLPEPVFARAQTVRMAEGLLEGDADEVTFTADRVGRYLIACGVLGHAQRGQWITLDVSTTAGRPMYR